jgi:hypothetical protein
MPNEETIALLLKLQGFDSINDVIKQFRDLKSAGEELSKEQEQALIALEAYKNVMKDVGTGAQVYNDLLVEEAQDRRIANQMLVEGTEAAREAEAEFERLAQVTRDNAVALKELAGAEAEGGGGFGGLASNMMKAEKVAMAIGTGSGLGRIGPMLESITGALGLGGGVGMAAGGLIFALEAILPKLEAFGEKMGVIGQKLTETQVAMQTLTSAAGRGPTRKKRALGRLESKIAALEDKEDELQGGLPAQDRMDLDHARAMAAKVREEVEQEDRDWKESVGHDKRQQELNDQQADLDIEANDPDAQYQARHKAGMARRNAEVDRYNAQLARRKRMDANLKRATNEGVKDLDDEDRAAKQAQREQDRAAKQAQREAERFDRQNTPEHQMRGLVAANTHGFDDRQQAQIARYTMENQQIGMDIYNAMDQAVKATQRQILLGVMKRSQIISDSNL